MTKSFQCSKRCFTAGAALLAVGVAADSGIERALTRLYPAQPPASERWSAPTQWRLVKPAPTDGWVWAGASRDLDAGRSGAWHHRRAPDGSGIRDPARSSDCGSDAEACDPSLGCRPSSLRS